MWPAGRRLIVCVCGLGCGAACGTTLLDWSHQVPSVTMSGAYGEPDWANPSTSTPAAASDANATTSWSAGEDFSGTGANVNVGGANAS